MFSVMTDIYTDGLYRPRPINCENMKIVDRSYDATFLWMVGRRNNTIQYIQIQLQ